MPPIQLNSAFRFRGTNSANGEQGAWAVRDWSRSSVERSSNGRCALCMSRELLARTIGEQMASLIWTVLVVVVILWLLGFVVGFGGGLIHLLLVVALLLLIYNLLTGRTRV